MADLAGDLQRALGEAYLLERELGRGGMGAVYLARDTQLHRAVAIKLLPPELGAHPELRERFLRETRLAASFSHPHVVPVHAIEERGTLLAFVMGYVDGETLGARVRRGGPLPVQEAVRLLQEVAWALSYAHGRGVVHRDIKPDNILIERATGRALVTDFGIARSVGAMPGEGLTRVGEVVGTPHFMSPEQAAGDQVDGRSDLYSLGVVAFFALTGKLPFDAPNPTALLAMHLTQPPPSLAAMRPDLPPALVEAVERALAKGPEERWGSGEELAAAFDGLRRNAPEVAPVVRVFLQRFGTATLAFLMLGGVAWYTIDRMAGGTSDDWILAAATIGAAMWGVAVSALSRVRVLLRQGFRYRDVHAAAGTLVADETIAREALRALPDEMRRRRRRLRIAGASLLLGPLAFLWVTVTQRVPMPDRPGVYQVSLLGALLALPAAIAIGLGITMLAADPLKRNPFLRLQALFWRGPLGRGVFRLGAWGMKLQADGGVAPTTGNARATGAGPRTVLLALPRASRRGLDPVAARLEAMERESAELAARERELEAALADTTGRDALGAGRTDLDAARTAVADELRAALEAARARREALLGAMERTRLELLRLRAGLGSVEAVRRAAEG